MVAVQMAEHHRVHIKPRQQPIQPRKHSAAEVQHYILAAAFQKIARAGLSRRGKRAAAAQNSQFHSIYLPNKQISHINAAFIMRTAALCYAENYTPICIRAERK